MLFFRAPAHDMPASGPLEALDVANIIDDAMRPGHFFVAANCRFNWIAARSETVAWEIFRGRLVDAIQTREKRTFLAWHVIEESGECAPTESTISVKFDVNARQIHVTRGLLAHVWEGYDAGGGVIESRETKRWTRELVGAIALSDFAEAASLRDELICLIWQALVGTSRLPLTSIEAPLPAFTFGQMHYVYRGDAGESPVASWQDLLSFASRPELARHEIVKLLEFTLRHIEASDLPAFADMAQAILPTNEIAGAWRAMFNAVSLSPYTQFVDHALGAFDLLAARDAISAADRIDFLRHLLTTLSRHLTAYDLVTFHHRGANYPDALLLDAVLKRYLEAIETSPSLFEGGEPAPRLRRRALRQGCLTRRHYEGHAVPDAPTSPGENARVLPASHPRVPEEQITQTPRRHRRLFIGDELTTLLMDGAKAAFAQSIDDLRLEEERVEMGLGVFIDRPLGYGKAIGEPDLTPLLAHEAFSPSIARRRWLALQRFAEDIELAIDREGLTTLFEQADWPAGLPHANIADCPRPTAALADVRKVADDFILLRTKPMGLRALLDRLGLADELRGRYRLRFLDEPMALGYCVCGRDANGEAIIVLGDAAMRRRVEVRVDASQGYQVRAGVELPRSAVRVLRVWEDADA